jgi:hypothetical protein
LQLDVVTQLPNTEARLTVTDRVEQPAHVLLPAEHSAVGVLSDDVVGEEVERRFPVRAIEVVTVLTLHALDLDSVGDTLSTQQELVDARGIGRPRNGRGQQQREETGRQDDNSGPAGAA